MPLSPDMYKTLWSYIVDFCRDIGNRHPAVYRLYRRYPALRKFNQKPDLSVALPTAPVSEEETGRQRRLRAIYAETVLLLARHRIQGWWDYHRDYSLFRFRDPAMLRPLLRLFVMRRAGDYKAFLRLSDQLDTIADNAEPEDYFVRLLAIHYGGALKRVREEFAALKSHIDAEGKRAFLIGFPVWGDAFINAFFTSALPSLMAEGNLPALCRERQVVLLIHTDEASRTRFEGEPEMRALERMGVIIRYAMLDATLLLRMKEVENNKYWHLGMIQSLQLYAAQSLNADYHIMLPDTIYADGYFERLLGIASRGAKAIMQTAQRFELRGLHASLAPYKRGNVLSVPPGDLMALAMNNQHPATRMMQDGTGPKPWPAHHCLIWEAENEVHFICPHQTIAYFDHALIAELPERFYFTLDSEIDKIIPEDCSVHFPEGRDGLVLVEVSEADVGEALPLVDTEEFCRIFWHRIESAKHLRFFEGDVIFPLNRSLRKGDNYRTREAIERDKAFIRDAVRAHRQGTSLEGVNLALLCLQAAEQHIRAAGEFDSLHRMAGDIWEEYKKSIDADGSLPTVTEVARLLWHFDMLAEAGQFLGHFPRLQPLTHFVREVLTDQGESISWARAWRGAVGDAKEVFVVGITIWGEDHLAFLLDYHFPCLLAPGNLPSLANEGKVILSIATDAEGQNRITRHPSYAQMERYAEFHFVCFSQAPTREEGASSFYSRYGMLDHHHVYLARALKANLFMMPADCVFSSSTFLALHQYLAKGFDACSVACIEANKEEVQPVLAAERKNDILALDGEWLLTLAAQHKSDYFRSLIFDPSVNPNAHPREFFWRIEGGYKCHSLFIHPLALSKRALTRPFHPDHENVDKALLPRILQDVGPLKILPNATEAAIMHCSSKDVRAGEYGPHRYDSTPEMLGYLLGVHAQDYPLHRHCLRAAQFFPCEDAEFPVSSTYPADIAYLIAGFPVLGESEGKDVI